MSQVVLEALPAEYQRFKEVVDSLARLLMQRRLFPPRYPSVQKALSEAFVRLDVFTQDKKLITLRIAGGSIYFLNFEMDITSGNNREIHLFRETLAKLSIGEIDFSRGTTKDELESFIEILECASRNDRTVDLNKAWTKINNIRIRHGLKYEPDESVDRNPAVESPPAEAPDAESKENNRKSTLAHDVSDVLQQSEKIQSGDRESAGNRILRLVGGGGKLNPMLLLLDSLKNYDAYTFSHSVNVAVITSAIGWYLGCSEEDIDSMSRAALLHDIGKLYIPKEIIHKTRRLTPSEWLVVKKHPVFGEKILREEGMDVVCRRVAYEHHMRYDMKGYPPPRPGRKLHLASHIVRIADSYDALTTKRPYRKQLGPYGAIRMMFKDKGAEFHPRVLDVFYSMLGNVPIGSVLKLSTGETALVIDVHKKHGGLPLVRILKDAEGNTIAGGPVIDLNEKSANGKSYIREITEIVDQHTRDVEIGSYVTKES